MYLYLYVAIRRNGGMLLRNIILNTMFWRHIRLMYENWNSFLNLIVVNYQFFQITTLRYTHDAENSLGLSNEQYFSIHRFLDISLPVLSFKK